jgi:hypothetical protein
MLLLLVPRSAQRHVFKFTLTDRGTPRRISEKPTLNQNVTVNLAFTTCKHGRSGGKGCGLREDEAGSLLFDCGYHLQASMAGEGTAPLLGFHAA